VLGYARDGGRRSGITGVEKVVQLLVDGLPRERFVSYLAYPAAGALRDRLGSRCSAMFDGEPRRWYDRRYVVELSDFIRKHGIELVVSHGLRFDWHAALAARRTAIPHVVVRPVALADEIMPASRRRLFALVDKWTLRSCAVVVAVSQASRLRMLRTQRVPVEKIVVIPNGVAIPVVSAAERAAARRGLDLEPEARIVGAVGQLIPRKSFDVMVQALGRIHDAHPDVVGVILGEGPERARLAALARSLDVRLLLPGFVSDPRAVVASFEIAVLPSRAEGMPLAVLESMALGVATVATAVAGTPEVIEDGISGCLVPPSDPAALAQALTRLLDDDARRAAIAAAGEQRITAQFTLRGMLAAFESLFEHTVARTRS
jgi:glycosyltransferase involved in cell wall biosynthesis